jgi:hypothetical protein
MTTTAIKSRPILFSGPMVRAILDGRKTQTRRVVKPQPGEGFSWPEEDATGDWQWLNSPNDGDAAECWPSYAEGLTCPYGQPGDQLWVREAWRIGSPFEKTKLSEWNFPADELGDYIHYREDDLHPEELRGQYRSPRFMPCWASRITLEITGIRCERLQEISRESVRAEGVPDTAGDWANGCPIPGHEWDNMTWQEQWRWLWSTIHNATGPNGWAANPWVWVVEFRKL